MPFVVPQQQQPERQKSTSMPSDHREQAPQPQYQQRPYRQPQQQSPWQQARQPQQQYRYQPAPQPQGQYRQPMQRDSYGQRGGGRQYQQPQPMPYSTRQQRQYTQPMRQDPTYSNRPQQGSYVGEGVYADGTPMPPMPSSGYNGQSLIQSNAGPAGGVYANFNQTPDVIGGVTPRAYLEEDDVYNKPMRVGRGGGGIY